VSDSLTVPAEPLSAGLISISASIRPLVPGKYHHRLRPPASGRPFGPLFTPPASAISRLARRGPSPLPRSPAVRQSDDATIDICDVGSAGVIVSESDSSAVLSHCTAMLRSRWGFEVPRRKALCARLRATPVRASARSFHSGIRKEVMAMNPFAGA
jgi:hypothetical protein